MDAKKTLAIISVIILIGILYFYPIKKDMRPQQLEKCTESLRSYCNYGGTDVLSDLDALLWLKNNAPYGARVLGWWDYGQELESIGKVKPIIKNPSKPILDSVAEIAAGNATKENYPTDAEKSVRDVAVFLTTGNENEALCIAKKYGVSYVYLTEGELQKYYWISYAGYDRHTYLLQEEPTVVINMTTSTGDNLPVYVNENAINSTISRLYLTGSYGKEFFRPVYDRKGIKIFSITYAGAIC